MKTKIIAGVIGVVAGYFLAVKLAKYPVAKQVYLKAGGPISNTV